MARVGDPVVDYNNEAAVLQYMGSNLASLTVKNSDGRQGHCEENAIGFTVSRISILRELHIKNVKLIYF